MKNVRIIMRKQWKDTWKNPTILIHFILFPVLGIIMTGMVKEKDMPQDFFVSLFAAMYVGMAPLISMASILSEEKEKNTLRVLLTAHVAPWQYLSGIGSFVFLACMPGVLVFCHLSDAAVSGQKTAFLLILSVGIIESLLLGAAIGVGCRNQMTAASAGVPVMLLFSFLPMLSMFNEKAAKVAEYTYSEQVRILIGALGNGKIAAKSVAVLFLNLIISGVLFGVLYQKQRGRNNFF